MYSKQKSHEFECKTQLSAQHRFSNYYGTDVFGEQPRNDESRIKGWDHGDLPDFELPKRRRARSYFR